MKKFDGNKYATEVEAKIANMVQKLKRTPKLVSIVIGDEKGALFYQKLKKKKASEVGIDIEIKSFDATITVRELIDYIKKLNEESSVNGIMLQLPLPKTFSKGDRDLIINSIAPNKDVDGMKKNSSYLAPVVRAADTAVSLSEEWIHHNELPYKVVIVGSEGFEGSKILEYYLHTNRQNSYLPIGVDKGSRYFKEKVSQADILISVAGSPDLIKPDMVKEGVVLIDVGSPKGDIDKNAYEKANYISPVPGGVGPLTIAYLMENIYLSARGGDLNG